MVTWWTGEGGRFFGTGTTNKGVKYIGTHGSCQEGGKPRAAVLVTDFARGRGGGGQ